MAKYIFITGGVVSSLGKGVAAASLGALLQAHKYKIRIRKLDPYLNVDPGTMSPVQHGEVFVTNDGVETDLDIGHYERFTAVEAEANDSYTSGKIYDNLIKKERKGDYLGKTVQVIPHVTNLIKDVISYNTEDLDFLICEVGGTVGDIEGLPFYDAIRQMKHQFGRENILYIHLTLVPYVATAKELKTKPTQHSINTLRSIGIQPDILLCRADRKIPESNLEKISLFTDIPRECVMQAIDQNSIYKVPVALHEQGLDRQVLRKFGLESSRKPDLSKWYGIVERIENSKRKISIGMIGKYNDLEDSYTSLNEALHHAGIAHSTSVEIVFIDAVESSFAKIEEQINSVSGIILPGGFGNRGVEGKIFAANYARRNNIPFLGICYGMQLAAVGIARELLNIKDANSTEVTKDCTNIIGLMTEWATDIGLEERNIDTNLGASMRLGGYKCQLKAGSKVHDIYKEDVIIERHRHRYEFNINYVKAFEEVGVVISGTCIDKKLVEIIEIPCHPWFVGVQFHPEFKSRPLEPHPLFYSFIGYARGLMKK